ncbi:glycosyltransferase family 4 protein [Nibrella saemangeumensis]|uniref:Glycosyltransferase family 4 protein n=1 Tax=Nibrella saemangeumensis TaxID=1084526 RepID=A0ABP8NEH8_9BACT
MNAENSNILGSHYPKNVAFVGDYLPRQCGIATFTADLYQSYHQFFPDANPIVVSVNDTPKGYAYPDEVRYEFYQHRQESYGKAAEFLNTKNVEVVCLQHEYGIFGGPAGNYILTLLQNLRAPVVTTFHTILENPDQDQLEVLRSIAGLSARVVCMTEKGKGFLTTIYGIPEEKIDLIPHGVPDMPFVDPHFYKDHFGMEGKQMLLTFGLLSPNKGIENVIRALPRIVAQFPNVVYTVLGATHPNLVREQGEVYRESLQQLAVECGVAEHVQFTNRFVELPDLLEYLGATDIYVTPYLNPAQITSGTLSYAFGCGKAVVSTPYWHAEELLSDGRGILVPFGDSEAIADSIIHLLEDETLRHTMRKKGYMMGRDMIWERVIGRYGDTFSQAHQRSSRRQVLQKPETTDWFNLPAVRTDHLFRLSDDTGIIQHARFHLPCNEEGYCTDDNARALVLTLMLEASGLADRKLSALTDTYAAFLNYAYSPEYRRFRNFMGYDRRWLEEVGSEDSTGRAIWALGACIGRSRDQNLITWAMGMFENVLPHVADMTSPRTWAFVLLGISEYRKKFSNDRLIKTIHQQLLEKLMLLFNATATDDWPWFEESLTYDNAKLPHALLLSDDQAMIEAGLRSLRWLMDLQTAETGHFQPIGCNGFYVKGQPRAYYDQQPVEAHSTISACLAAYELTGDGDWYRQALSVYTWFMGQNDLSLPLYDSQTGGCRDGLHIDRVNRNQGAESTLSYLLSLTELHIAQRQLAGTPQLSSNIV